MAEDTRQPSQVAAAASALPADRFLHLLWSFSTLRSEGKVLVDQIRGSLLEMRELRGQFRKHKHAYSAPTGNGPAALDERLRQRYGLTRREVEVARLLSEGKSNAVIAGELNISPHTARHHTQRVLTKLKVHSRAEAGAKLRR